MATRFYLHNEPAEISVTPDAAWEVTSSPAVSRRISMAKKGGDTLATITGLTSTTGQDRLHYQGISDPLPSGIVFNTGVTYKCYVMALESNADDNIVARFGARVVSLDGTTVRHTILSVADYSTATEFNTTLRNKAFIDGDAGTGSYTTVAGDRLVIEIGHNDSSGASISGQSRYGSGGAGVDAGENETDTTTSLNPWFETSATFGVLSITEGFDVTPDNTTLTVQNTRANLITNAPVSDSGIVLDSVGTFSAMYNAAAQTRQLRIDFPTATELWIRLYFQMDTLPPANNVILALRTAALGATSDVQVSTTGALRLRNQAQTLIDTSTTTLAVDTWHRLEFHQTTTRWECRIFAGTNHHGSTADEDETAFGGTVSQAGSSVVELGVNTSATWLIWLDAFQYRTDTWAGSAFVSGTTYDRAAALDATATVAAAGVAEHPGAAALSATATIAAAGIEILPRSVALDATPGIAVSGTTVTNTQVQNLVATAVSNSAITLSWNDVGGLTGEVFDIERDGTIILSDYAGAHSVGSPYTDSGLDPGTIYTYRVRAVL